MGISFVSGRPALLLEKERILVAGDLHIGMEFKMMDKGLYFPGAAKRMADSLLSIYEESRAKGMILLGDIKDRLMNVTKDDEEALRAFFSRLNGVGIRIARGNHDAYLQKILARLGISATVEDEILLGDTALLHGNTMPSEEAMMKRYVITGHSHVAANVNGIDQKAWAILSISGKASGSYEKYNKRCRLVMVPAFNDMIIGTSIDLSSRTNMPLIRRGVFDIGSLKLYDLRGNLIS